MAVLVLDEPRVLDEGDPLQLLILLVSPADKPAEHLKSLATIARVLQDCDIHWLVDCEDENELAMKLGF